ncbi:MAG: DEAD/DEAH box helicase [Planctomycetota bacterium]|nr:DEAD/DEAH box helicase [Planctomycetota bacterium]
MTKAFQGGRRGPSRGRRPAAAPSGAPTTSSDPIRPLDPTLTPPDITTFHHWELGAEIQGAIEAMGITVPSPIQRLAIGPVLAGKDVIAKAETGTGKTLAFGAPMMAKIDPARASVLGLVMCPTRELAEQVQKVLFELGKPRGIEVALVVGGEPLEPQVKALKRGAQVVVGTPGRILDLYKQKFLSFPWTEFAILDEADVMFEFGFIDDVKEILSYTPEERQTLLFSATFPIELLKLARENTRDPAEVATAAGLKTVDNIEQSVIFLDDEDRTLALMRLIENSDPEDTFLVFCPRRTDVDKLIRRLERMPFSIKALHGGYDQAARFRVMAAFRTGEVKALIATDVASRGLDVKHVSTVVNYGSPHDITDYTHRIGRTGRAGRKGRAITLVGGIDRRKWTQIEREATWKIPEVDPPLRGERPRPRRDEVPVGEERPVTEERPARDTGPAREDRARSARPAREERPRREAPPRETRAREDGPREVRPRRDDHPTAAPTARPRRDERPLRARDESAPAARSTAGHGRPRPQADEARAAEPRENGGRAERSWPRDEHSPARPGAPLARDPMRQAEPRPDDPVDRRDRPLRQRPESPRWPTDDEAPPREERARREDTPRAGSARQGTPPREGPRAATPRDEAGRSRTPRRTSDGPAPANPRTREEHTERHARADARPAREAFFAPDAIAPENDFRPRGPDSGRGASRPAARATSNEGTAPRAAAGRPPTGARHGDEAPRAREPRREETAPRASHARGRDEDGPVRASRSTHAPRGSTAQRGPAARPVENELREDSRPRRDAAPRSPAPRRSEHAPRSEAAPREPSAARARQPEAPRPIAPRPAAPRRRASASEVDAGEVRPIQSRHREPRPER